MRVTATRVGKNTVFHGPSVPSKKRIATVAVGYGALNAGGALYGGAHPHHAAIAGVGGAAVVGGIGMGIRAYRQHKWNKALEAHNQAFHKSRIHHGGA